MKTKFALMFFLAIAGIKGLAYAGTTERDASSLISPLEAEQDQSSDEESEPSEEPDDIMFA